MLIYASSTPILFDFSWKCLEYKSMKNFTPSSKPNDFWSDLHMVLGSLASFAISAVLCWFTTAKKLIPNVHLALQQWKYFKGSSARKTCSSPDYKPGHNGFHTPSWYLCCVKYKEKLPQMWRKTPAKLLSMCSPCTNCSNWNSPAPFVQQQSGRAQYHICTMRRKQLWSDELKQYTDWEKMDIPLGRHGRSTRRWGPSMLGSMKTLQSCLQTPKQTKKSIELLEGEEGISIQDYRFC